MSSERWLDATAIARAVACGERSAEEVVGASLERIERSDDELGTFLEVHTEPALERARALDAERAHGAKLGPLFGVPVALKANMCLAGVEVNCGSRVLSGYRPPYTASFVQRLLDAGAVPVGMTNMDEFAMGSSSENSAFHTTKNPWDPARTPGGSSSGSAVAVASGMLPIALGSDTGGSVRQPAALCGILGFKPTYGRVSRYGLVAFGSSLDQVSPFARSVRDIERVLTVISGADEMDSTCEDLAPYAPEYGSADPDQPERLDGLRVGVPAEYFPAALDEGVRAAVEEAISNLVQLGAERVELSLPHTDYAIPTYYVVATAEASSNLARYDGVRYGARVEGDGSLQGMFAATRDAGFGAEVKRRILLGTHVLSSGYYDAWYGRALKARALLRRDFEQAFADVDVVVGPTAPTAAFLLGEKADDPLAMYLSDILTAPISLAGLPAISQPCGFVDSPSSPQGRLPVGLQIVAGHLQDARVLRVARALEAASQHLAEHPVLAGEGAGA